jgi:mRNA interferase RelE/StbE
MSKKAGPVPGKTLSVPLKHYKLELTDQAVGVLEKIAKHDPQLYRRFVNVLDALEHDPFSGKALKGELKGHYSYRVGSYRVIYRIYRDQLLVIVIDIGHRREIYR